VTAFEDSYTGQIRKLVGHRKLITPGVRAIIQDDEGNILFVRRKDTNTWGMPAGHVELNESVFDALKREVKEETGLDVVSATAIAIYSEPRFSFTNKFGDEFQLFALVFRVDEWEGSLIPDSEETSEAKFFPLNGLPELPSLYVETLEDLRDYDGNFIVK
jgi:ADP-ribose pyrophosphatase YjhB (NUDIX family)